MKITKLKTANLGLTEETTFEDNVVPEDNAKKPESEPCMTSAPPEAVPEREDEAEFTGFSIGEPAAPPLVTRVPTPPLADPPAAWGWPWQLFSKRQSQAQHHEVRDVPGMLHSLYTSKLLPIEKDSDFHKCHLPELPPAYFSAQPMVLVLGQYSTGKTTFIRHLLQEDYPGQQIGPEPSTDRFVVICHGDQVQGPLPGNALIHDRTLPFEPLGSFGNKFLQRLVCAKMPNPILQGVTFIDTPGVLSGEKQGSRGYDYDGVVSWFSESAAMIILFFDAHKLDISDEFQRCIASLAGHQDKLRIVLNKADRLDQEELLRVHGALLWALGKVIDKPEVVRVFIGNFWDEPPENQDHLPLFQRHSHQLLAQIERLPCDASLHKLSELSKRARNAKAHALLLDFLHTSMPTFWGHAEKQDELIDTLEMVYQKVAWQHGVPIGDLPDIDLMQMKLSATDFSKFKKIDKKKLAKLEQLLYKDIPDLQKFIAAEQGQDYTNEV